MLVLLSLSVVLTLVLFILSRSITDVAVSSKEEESARAFSAAEAGIERSLVVGSGNSSDIGDAHYVASVTSFALGGYDVPFPSPLFSGENATVWFVSHDANGNLICNSPSFPCFHGDEMKVCCGNMGTGADTQTTPVIELSVYYESPAGSLAGIKIGRAFIDPSPTRRGTNVNILAPDAGTCTIGNQTYQFHTTITFAFLGIPAASYQNANGLQFAKIRMLYNTDKAHVVGSTVNFAGSTTLPSQGQIIDSNGSAGTGGTNNTSNRRIVVYQGWAEFPFASNSMFSPLGITE